MTGPIRDFETMERVARSLPPVAVAVAGAADLDVLGGAVQAVRAGIARVLLVGDAARIAALLGELGEAEGPGIALVPAVDDAQCVERAVDLCARGEAGVLLKGMVGTGALLRGALSQAAGLREAGSLLSDVLVCPNPFRGGRPLWGVTDGGLNVAPGLAEKRQILRNGLAVMRALGHREPRVAILCASEKADPAMPATMDAKALAELAREGAFGPCLVEGPLSLDVAASEAAARHKGVPSEVAGRADLLVAPSVEAGNLMAKALYLAARLPVAHVIAGARVPILINSRNDTAEDRFRSILLAMVVSARLRSPLAVEPETPGRRPTPAGPAPRILVVNPGATSTKIALCEGREERWREDVAHPAGAFAEAKTIFDQLDPRLLAVRQSLSQRGVDLSLRENIAAVVGRGGLLPPLPGGTYRVDQAMLADLRSAQRGEHASNLGAPIAAALAEACGSPALIADPVSVDEMREEAKVTGWPGLSREALAHALNLRAVARRVAAELGEPLERVRLIGIHLGTGISMAAFERGRMVDLVNPRDEGPFSADRAGALPTMGLAKLVIREGWSVRDCERRLGREAGLVALCGTSDLREVRGRAQAGETASARALEAMALGIAKWALGLVASLEGVPDGFFLTGGMAKDAALVEAVRAPLRRVAEVRVVPGEDEIAALAEAALRVLDGEEQARDYAAFRKTSARGAGEQGT